MSDVYSNDQVAEQLGISPNTVRSWKSKNAADLIDGQHWITDNGATYWTIAGLEALKVIQGTIRVKSAPTTPTGSPTTESDPEGDPATLPLERYRPMVNWMARLIVPQLLPELDREVAQGFFQAAATPMTSEECVAVLVELGLPPINLAALADGSIAGLLQQQQEN